MDKPLQERVRDYMGGTIRNMGGILLVGGAVEDHVHLLAKLRGDVAVSKAIGEIKACATG
jgi:putative transposase